MKRKHLQAFSLTELLIALAIVGILVLIALPNLMPLISEAKGTEAKLQLKHLYTLEKRYFYMNSKYTNDFKELGFEPSKLVSAGGNANYIIEVTEASAGTFKATAKAATDFDQDGEFNLWEIDQDQKLKEITKD
jgi:type IV pilus assembly protein PilE